MCPRCGSVYVNHVQWCEIDGETLVQQDQDPLVGAAIERYEITERLGMGGMGAVYRAKHAVIDREYAIKVLYGDFAGDDKFRARFKREAQSISKIRHPNVVQVEDFGTTATGLTFLAMELVTGRTLEEIIAREAPLSPTRTAGIARQIAAGLDAAHALGFVHRDVKPSNVMLTNNEAYEGEFVKILDFGTVSLRSIPSDERLTSIGHIIGTPTYMAPEQSQDPGVGPTADIYSLGCIMHEMLAGSPPFVGTGRAEVMVKHITEAPPPAPPSRGLEVLIKRMLEKHPTRRPQTCAEIVHEIEALNLGLPGLLDAARPWPIGTARATGLSEAAVDQDAFHSAPTNHMLIEYPTERGREPDHELVTPPSDPVAFDPIAVLASSEEMAEWGETWAAGARVDSAETPRPASGTHVAYREEGSVARAVDPLDSETSLSARRDFDDAIREVLEADLPPIDTSSKQKKRSTLVVRQRDTPRIETADLTIEPENSDAPTVDPVAELLFEPERPNDAPPVPEDDAGPTQVDFRMSHDLDARPQVIESESLKGVSFIDDDAGITRTTMDTMPPNALDGDTPEDLPGEPAMGTAPTNPVELTAPQRPPTPVHVPIPASDMGATATKPGTDASMRDARLAADRDTYVQTEDVPATVDGAPQLERPGGKSRRSSAPFAIAIVVLLLAIALLVSVLLFNRGQSDVIDLSAPTPAAVE